MEPRDKPGRLPKISIVTACYNAEKYVEATLKSVLNQRYDNLEYIVIDGNSSDSTVDIIKKYENQLSVFISEPDDGQYHAIQKGLEMATGDIMCWLNADDIMMPWTLSVVGEIFEKYPDLNWITGQPSFLNRKGQLTSSYTATASYPQKFIANGWYSRTLGGFLQQESMFWRKRLWDQAGSLDCSLSLAADFELWARFAKYSALTPVDIPLSAFRKLPNEQRSSVAADKYDQEVDKISSKLSPAPALWKFIADKGLIFRSLARLLIHHKSPLILFDEASEEWKMIRSRRPISRVSLKTLKEQHNLRSTR